MQHDYRIRFKRGKAMLITVGWRPKPTEMFRPPTAAKGTPLHIAGETTARRYSISVKNLVGDALLAARIGHFISISGTKAHDYFLSGRCPIDEQKIGQLSRRMPPFIRAKMDQLLAGSVNVASNPGKVFDTNGWEELRRRMPKFRATMEQYARSPQKLAGRIGRADIARIKEKLISIQKECAQFNRIIAGTQGVGIGTTRKFARSSTAPINWGGAYQRFALVLGVLQKTNRDLKSKYWKKTWVPTVADITTLRHDCAIIDQASADILDVIRKIHD